MCVYQWDSSWLQAWCWSSGVHVVKQTVYLPQRNSSSSVTDLKTERGRDLSEADKKFTTHKYLSNDLACLIYLYGEILFTQSDFGLYWR